MTRKTRIVIADDHAVVREGIRHVLGASPDFEVVGEAGTGREAVRLTEAHKPDVVVLDISMPDGGGLDVVGRVRQSAPASRVLVLSIHDDERYVRESVRAGANGYLRKDSTPAELRDAVRAVHRGESYFSPAIAERLAAAERGAPEGEGPPAGRLAALTPRERDVLRGIVEGLTNKEIAARLEISTRTVESHRESLMQKLGVRNVAALTRLALEEGF